MPFAGTGIAIDGFDISTGMLRVAQEKCVYRNLQAADLTNPLGLPAGRFGGLISCGTFTLGHLGPPALMNGLRMARAGALCVIGINSEHFGRAGFDRFFAELADNGSVDELRYEEVPIYAESGHANKVKDYTERVKFGKLAVFRTT